MKFFSTRKTGDITTRFSDAFTIKDVFTNIALTLVLDIGMALNTGVILFRMNSGLFAIILFMTIVSILLVFIFKQPYKKINEEQMQQSAVLNSQIIEGLRAVETIKGNANEEVELDNIEKEYIKSLRISYKEGMLSNVQGVISQLISTAGNLILMYFGIMQVLKGNITLGSYMAFNTLSGYFMEPMSNLVGLQLSLQEANISMKRFSEILDYEEEQPEAEQNLYEDIEKIEGDIEIKHVTFRYGNRKPALNDISFTIPKGKKVALDESTSNLDFATENIIFDMIYNKLKKKSMLIVAHRLATVKNCDVIIVMDHGEIAEQGTHEELLAKKGRYYQLWEMQQGNFKVKEETEKLVAVTLPEMFDEDEMMYVDGGFHVSYNVVNTVCNIATLGVAVASYIKQFGVPGAITRIGTKIVAMSKAVLNFLKTNIAGVIVGIVIGIGIACIAPKIAKATCNKVGLEVTYKGVKIAGY